MWKKISQTPPPIDTVINTKIDDGISVRNEQRLIFDGKMWWLKDKSMYVYYKPTHWNYCW